MSEVKEKDPYYLEISNQITEMTKQDVKKVDITWSIIECITSVVCDLDYGDITELDPSFMQTVKIDAKAAAKAGKLTHKGMMKIIGVVQKYRGKESSGKIPNPWFVFNGQHEPESPYTKKFLKARKAKKVGSSIFTMVGHTAETVTQVDGAGVLKHGNASASTALHIKKLRDISVKTKGSETITAWLDLILRLKYIKAGIRGTQLVGAAVPLAPVGITTKILSTAGKVGVKLHYKNIVYATASHLHWRAFQEQAIGAIHNKDNKNQVKNKHIGPASEILYELFARRGASGLLIKARLLKKYDVDKIIHEPLGWLAVADKIILM
jgi:hypothetical protein